MLDKRVFKEAPVKVLNLCSKGIINRYTSGINIANITYFIQKATKANVVDLFTSILQYIKIISLEQKDFQLALTYGFKDIEDAYQYRAVEKAERMTCIITRNVKDFQKSLIGVQTPEDFMKDFQQE